MSTPGANAIATKMRHLVAGGMHPASLALADLDSEPEILWAGGMPWSLRDSVDGPTLAREGQIGPGGIATPHLHTAALTPERVDTPLWDAFTAAVWPDPALRAWALRVLSIAVTGYADRALPVLLGETGRGKTQLVSLVMSVLGSYAHAADSKLLNPTSQEHSTIVYALKGRRLSFIDEAPSEARAGQERLKQLTGGGELTARQMNQNPVTFYPTHTLVLTANDEPLLTDPAVRSRARLIPCEGDPEEVRRARAAIGSISGPAWRAEAPGVLAKLMTEAARWLADPTTATLGAAPESIRYVAESLAAEQDPVTVWVSEETEPNDIGTPSRELYQAFTASCLRNNLRRDQIPSETKWGRALNRLGYPSKHTMNGKHRPLVIRQHGMAPVTPIRPTIEGFLGHPQSQPQNQNGPATPLTTDQSGSSPTESVGEHDGLGGSHDGFMTGTDRNPSGTKAQVNHSVSENHDGYDGFSSKGQSINTHTKEKDIRHQGRNALNPSSEGAKTGVDLRKRPDSNPSSASQPVMEPSESGETGQTGAPDKPKRTQSPEAKARAAEKREAKRREAIEQAAGPTYELPALVLRDGSVRSISVEYAHALLTTITAPDGGFVGPPLTVDVETSGYPVGHADYLLRTIQLGNEHFAVVLDPARVTHHDLVRTHMKWATKLHAHSAVADLVPLVHAGIIDLDTWERMHDTVIPAKLADPALTDSDPGLKKLSTAVLGDAAVSKAADEARSALFKAGKWLTEVKVTTPIERSGWAQVDSRCETMIRYAASDVLDTAAIAARLPWPEPALLDRERTVHRMVSRVAHEGLRIDGEHAAELLAQHTQARAEAANLVRELSGGEIENPGSNDQVGKTLTALGARLPATKTGKPSVAEGAIDPLRDTEGPIGALATAVLTYREHDTACGTFLEPYLQLTQRGDGRARPTVYTLGADTGRMSCVRPNLQQVPRLGGFRACITADPGEVLISADFAGVELRVAGALSQDQALIEILQDPSRDIHREIAQLVWGPEAGKAERYRAKPMVFGRLYGAGVTGLARDNGVDEITAKRVIEAMDALTPGLTEWSRMTRGEIEAGRTQWQTYSGRIIHLPKDSPHAGPNYKIQGTARELLMDALLRWHGTGWGNAVILPVHDEVVAKVPAAEAEEATAALVQCMTSELYGVTIKAEASEPSFAWADSH
jgi:P4 family phage/plasmid primase-like protien